VAITYAKDARAASEVVERSKHQVGRPGYSGRPSDSAAATTAVEQTVMVLGGLDVLVNNAGTAIPKSFEETTLEEMDRLIDINLRRTLAATQAALKHMDAGGRIIMIGSSVGERVLTPGLVAYSATKGAVKMLTQGLPKRSPSSTCRSTSWEYPGETGFHKGLRGTPFPSTHRGLP
jgi:3-oxoacyl-[acyl-carrier protein] reductase